MAAGALSISFIPQLSGYLASGKKDLANEVYRFLSTWMGLILMGLIILAEIFAKELSYIIAPGFNPQQIEILTNLIRIILPAQFFFYWGGLAISVQQTFGFFWFSALAPIVYNSGIILGGVLLHASYGIYGFSFGVLSGAFIGHGFLQWWGVQKVGFSPWPLFKFNAELWNEFLKYFRLTLPIMLGFSIVATDEWISKYFASQIQGAAISWLNYARTEMRIPIAVIGQAAGIASFPYLTRLWAEDKKVEFSNLLQREIIKVFVLASLAIVILFTHALPVTHFIYGGGKMTSSDLLKVSGSLKWMSLGVLFWVLQILLARGFYAKRKTWIPPLIGGICSLVSLPLYYYLNESYSYEGLAMASSLSIGLYCLLLWALLQISLKNYFTFLCFWILFIGATYFISERLLLFEIYQQTRATAFLAVLICSVVVGGAGYFLQRKVLVRYTKTALF
jgi:putative peptidoglycan lipid II flippase